MTSRTDSHRLYAKDCWIEGAVDYFYGSGDALLENCTLYNLRSGSVIVAPSHKNVRFGYVFRNCIVDGNTAAADGKQKLGRPWHNSPRAVYIHTTMRIPLAPEGWTNMGAIPGYLQSMTAAMPRVMYSTLANVRLNMTDVARIIRRKVPVVQQSPRKKRMAMYTNV